MPYALHRIEFTFLFTTTKNSCKPNWTINEQKNWRERKKLVNFLQRSIQIVWPVFYTDHCMCANATSSAIKHSGNICLSVNLPSVQCTYVQIFKRYHYRIWNGKIELVRASFFSFLLTFILFVFVLNAILFPVYRSHSLQLDLII